MLNKFLPKLLLLGIITMLVSLNFNSPSITTRSQASDLLQGQRTIVLGDISDNPQKKIRRFKPLADYLAANLSKFEIGKGQVKIAPDINTMIQWLKSGEVNLYFDSPYPAMLANDRAGAKPILRRWKKGSAEYHSVIFTMKKSGINSLSELKGKMIAFDDRRSTSGYQLPLVELFEAGLNPIEKKSAAAQVKLDTVGYVFSEDDENTIEWVLSNKVAAGAIDNQTFADIPPKIRQQMIICAETEPIARSVVLINGDIEPELAEEIKQLLLNLDRTPEGNKILQEFGETTKFDESPTEDSLEKMRKIDQLLQNRGNESNNFFLNNFFAVNVAKT